jgi:hypothetical protein
MGLVISADKVVFDNPAWNAYLKWKLDAANKDLGVTCTPVHDLRQLSLIGDQELNEYLARQQSPRVYGFVDVTLPSAHDGGVVSLRRVDETTYDSATGGTYGSHCAAWYSDVVSRSIAHGSAS